MDKQTLDSLHRGCDGHAEHLQIAPTAGSLRACLAELEKRGGGALDPFADLVTRTRSTVDAPIPDARPIGTTAGMMRKLLAAVEAPASPAPLTPVPSLPDEDTDIE